MAYHSCFNEPDKYKLLCGLPLIALNASPGGSAAASIDPVDEALELYRPLSLFRAFDVRGPGDKLLVYLVLFINACLRRLADRKPPPPREEARSLLFALAHDRFVLPGAAGFPLGSLVATPASREEEEAVRSYLRQCREEAGRRLLDRLYSSDTAVPATAPPNRHWLAFAHRRFMDRAM